MSDQTTDPVVDNQPDNGDVVVNSGEQQQDNGGWYDNLDADLKNHPSIQKFSDPGKLAKSYVELEKLVGKEKIVLPKENATAEELSAFYNKIGRPEEVTGYETPELEIDNQELLMKEHTLEAFKAKAHELGLTKKQFAELYGFYHENGIASYNQLLEQQNQIRSKTENELRKEWGSAYEAKVDSAQKVVNQFFADAAKNPAFTHLANDKNFISSMAKLAESMGEDVIQGAKTTTLTPSQAQSEINEMLSDKSNPLHDNSNPEHQAALDKFLSLQSLANAG